MWNYIKEDIKVTLEKDPAANNFWDVLITYPGMHAVWFYRIANFFWGRNFKFIGKAISTFARFLTGIEIHPGAEIGRRLFIDHGSGVVIGETTIIGNDVTLYQGVTLGGTGKEKGKRHPTIGDHVLISTGAKVLGSIIIGEYSKIGAGSVVLKDVPANSTVVGIPGRVVMMNGLKVKDDMNQVNLPDPVADRVNALQLQINFLRQELEKMREGIKEYD